jgi:sensor histidine kinase YesM
MSTTGTNPLGEAFNASHNAPELRTVRGHVFPDRTHITTTGRERGNAPYSMSVMKRFFGTKEATFWSFQLFGWTGYGLVRMFQALTIESDLGHYSLLYFAAILIGVSMTVVLRHVYRVIRDKPLPLILPIVVVLCAAFGLLFSSLELAMAPVFIPGFQSAVGLFFFSNAMFEATVLFAWSAIYFGYHYYAGMQEQKAQVLKATAAAHQAQLKMLRYQLNPHFLFNTLNAISTLVLEKSEEDANKMLTKLSSFLRFTLVNQPTQRITLEQELHALGLYLDIEKVRFEDRLNIDYDIGEDAKSALVPSLILQPLIENAIKYTIAPSVDGGTIKVCAKLQGERLVLLLTDNGPGLDDINHIVSQSGSGVGLTNTKERLFQIYGADHKFELTNLEPNGLQIRIDVPRERNSNERSAEQI